MTIYTTKGYDESVTGTQDQIMDYIASETDLFIQSITRLDGIHLLLKERVDKGEYEQVGEDIRLIETIIL